MKFLFISMICSFLVMVFINYIPSFKKSTFRQELDLFIGKKCYHIHHWISALFILFIILLVKNIKKKSVYHIIIGTLLGCILEDFLFRNVFSLRNCNIKNNK